MIVNKRVEDGPKVMTYADFLKLCREEGVVAQSNEDTAQFHEFLDANEGILIKKNLIYLFGSKVRVRFPVSGAVALYVS